MPSEPGPGRDRCTRPAPVYPVQVGPRPRPCPAPTRAGAAPGCAGSACATWAGCTPRGACWHASRKTTHKNSGRSIYTLRFPPYSAATALINSTDVHKAALTPRLHRELHPRVSSRRHPPYTLYFFRPHLGIKCQHLYLQCCFRITATVP